MSIGMMIVQAVVNPFGTQALAGYSATMRVENVFSLIFVSIGNAVSPYVSQNLGAKKIDRIKKGYHAALVLDVCFAVLAFIVIETLHTQISSLFLGKDGTALAYQVSEGYMRWIGYFFIFMGIKMATDGVLRGLGIMRPFLIANMVNLAIRLSVALICAPRFGIVFVWLAVHKRTDRTNNRLKHTFFPFLSLFAVNILTERRWICKLFQSDALFQFQTSERLFRMTPLLHLSASHQNSFSLHSIPHIYRSYYKFLLLNYFRLSGLHLFISRP